MFFDIVQNDKFDNNYSSSFYKIKLNEELLNKYQDIIKVSNNIYIVGYLNSYLKDNQNIYYIFPKKIKLLDKNYNLKNDIPIFVYDSDGVVIWNGKRCEAIPLSEEENQEKEAILSKYR